MARTSAFIIVSLLLSCTTVVAQQPATKDATVFSYRLHYLEAGRGAPVILLHGSGGEGARWMPTIQGLAQNSVSSRPTRSAGANRTSR